MAFHRARAPAQKADRRDAILRAASLLFREQGVLPTASAVAEKTGLGKGTVYLYFRSKEEIYLALLQNAYLAFLGELSQRLQAQSDCRGEVVATQLCLTLQQHLDFLPLSALAHAILEQNASTDACRQYRQALATGLLECVQIIVARSRLNESEAMQLLLCSYGQITGLWQTAHPPENIRCIMAEEGSDILIPDFWRDIEYALRRLWRD